MQGIFKPRVMELPLSIRTAVEGGPYDDSFTAEGLLRYRYRGTDPQHPHNVGLWDAWRRQVPLVYFHGIVPRRYLAIWPVFIRADDPAELAFTVAVDEERMVLPFAVEAGEGAWVSEGEADARRRYVTSLMRRRLHQRSFRARVLRAYREQCAFCRLRHSELLDAAHIVADTEERGEPLVRNGVSLCKLHHAAFDALFLTIRPDDYRIEVRQDILHEEDGPMLLHGLQGLHGQLIQRPRSPELRPDRELLASRYDRFAKAAGAA